MKKFIVLFLMLFSISSFAEQVEVKGVGTIPYDGAVFSKDPSSDDKKKVVDAAKVSAWKNYLASLNVSKQKMLLTHEKEVSANFDKFITEFVIVDQKVDKELKTFTVIIRASFNSGALDQFLQSASLGAEKNNAAYNSENESAFSFLFTARKATSLKQFDTRVTKKEKASTSNSVKDSEDGATVSASSEKTTGGSQLKQEDKVTYAVTSSRDVDAAMGEILSASGINYASYDDIVGNCAAPPTDQFKKEYVDNDELTAQTRTKIINAARECGIKFFAIGTLDAGVNDTDPVSGNKRVFVSVTAQIWDISAKPLPRKIGSVGPVQFSGMGPDQSVASKNALNLAAKETGKQLVDQLNAKKVR
jgi:hypothetical protein